MYRVEAMTLRMNIPKTNPRIFSIKIGKNKISNKLENQLLKTQIDIAELREFCLKDSATKINGIGPL